jgi:HPt (histidine-containing phosphotransfer) domain-containing protein
LAASLPTGDFSRIVETFEEDLARLAADFEAATGRGERDAARRSAHALAGAAAAIGAKGLEAAARRAMLAPAGDTDGSLNASIQSETAAALRELAALARP